MDLPKHPVAQKKHRRAAVAMDLPKHPVAQKKTQTHLDITFAHLLGAADCRIA